MTTYFYTPASARSGDETAANEQPATQAQTNHSKTSSTSIDYLTVLRVKKPADAMMTKRLFRTANGGIDKCDYDHAFRFDVEMVPINDLGDLCSALLPLAQQPQKVVIRGRPIGGHRNVLRRKRPSEYAAFDTDRTGHHWLMVDFDAVPLPMLLDADDDDLLKVGFLVRLLPAEFHRVSYFYQWSCGQNIDGGKTLRCHVWFWSAKRYTDVEYENWAKWVNGAAGERLVDPSVFRCVQPNYTAEPLLDGVADPVIGERCGIVMGECDEVPIVMPAEDWDAHLRQEEADHYAILVELGLRQVYTGSDAALHRDDEKYLYYLCRIGDDFDGFYEPMRAACWHWGITHPESEDELFKAVLRRMAREAQCNKRRNLNDYLSDYRLDSSLRGARERAEAFTPRSSFDHALERIQKKRERSRQAMLEYKFKGRL